MGYQRDKKEIDVVEVVNYLTRSFKRAIAESSLSNEKAVRTINGVVNPSDLYLKQVEFCYLVDNILRGPTYIVPKFIQETNEFIADISVSY